MTELEKVWRRAMVPPEPEPVWRWAERAVVLSTRQATSFPGPYRSSITPYVRGPMEAFSDPRVWKITLAKGAQTGGTLVEYVCALWAMCEDPGPIMFVYPNADLARSASESRVMPMIDDSPIVAGEKTEDPDEYTKLQYRLRRCTVNWVGSNSPANLASRPVRYLFLDEVDKYPGHTDREADAVSLAIQRTKTFWNRKIFITSTPTTPEGAVWVSFLDGDQRRFFLPCHKCGVMQWLKWGQVKFDSKATPDKAAAEAHYECEACRAKWTDQDKRRALPAGEWRSTGRATTSGHASFHLSSLYAPWTTWAQLVQRFMRTKQYPNELQDFVNSELGEPWIQIDNQIKDAAFAKLEGDYTEGQKFAEVEAYKGKYDKVDAAVIAGVDVQKGYLVATLRQWVIGGDSGLVWHGTVANLEALDKLCDVHGVQWVMIDRRYRTREVDEFALAHVGFVPCEGVKTRVKALYSSSTIDLDEGRSRAGGDRVIGIINHDADQLKDILAGLIQRDENAPAWLVPKGYASNEDYCKQMSSERRVNGKWVLLNQRANHAWDTEVLTLLGAIRFGYYGRYIEHPEEGAGKP